MKYLESSYLKLKEAQGLAWFNNQLGKFGKYFGYTTSLTNDEKCTLLCNLFWIHLRST